MPTEPQAVPITILLTGVTGFVGKVVLEELVRRRAEGTVQFDRILVPIRPLRGQTALERFLGKVVKSPCFSRLPGGWHNDVRVITCDLMEPGCGLNAASKEELTSKVTHIIHCAGCVSFDSPIDVLLAENEQLATLPKSALEILAELHEGKKDADQIRHETGHPNDYTLAKCLAEHFMVENKGATPLTIVRPSIISASWQYPFPGWIDSFAALAGPISAFALGGLKVLHGDPSAILDVVPVDKVAECLIKEALCFGPTNNHKTAPTKFVHCVSTTKHGPSTWDIVYDTVMYFSQPENIVLYKPTGWYVGTDNRRFRFYEFVFQYLPLKMAELAALLMLDWDRAAKARKMLMRLRQIDTHFRYFVEHTYEYRCDVEVLPADFDKRMYMEITLQGMRQNLLLPLLARENPREAAAHHHCDRETSG
ncbi:hypothetical protein SLS53_006744 [Cytospora paraplurivora]|uniref:Fatty acyl-CoA reductase n=1 Tax=Cytospora paraplurivora TaxID=2898453 RepID=A0AAN9U460_9PEZI